MVVIVVIQTHPPLILFVFVSHTFILFPTNIVQINLVFRRCQYYFLLLLLLLLLQGILYVPGVVLSPQMPMLFLFFIENCWYCTNCVLGILLPRISITHLH